MSDMESLNLQETKKWIPRTMRIKYLRLKPVVTQPVAETIEVLDIPHNQEAIMTMQ